MNLMKNVINKVVVFFAVCTLVSPVIAENAELEAARKNISALVKGVKSENIIQSPIPGLYQVSLPPTLFYASADGRYIVKGDLIDSKSNKNITQLGRNNSVASAITAMGEDSMIIFGNDTLKHTVTVFTDIDCGYCRKLHNEVKQYNALGIRVRYMAYPRAGIGSKSFKKAEAVWCSKDKVKAMTDSKSGVKVKSEKCKNPIAQHYSLGEKIGIRGTPAIVLSDGTVVGGYIPAKRLSDGLNAMFK